MKWISCMCTYMYSYIYPLPLGTPFHPAPSTLLSLHRAPSWAPCAIQQISTSYLFYTWHIYFLFPLTVRPMRAGTLAISPTTLSQGLEPVVLACNASSINICWCTNECRTRWGNLKQASLARDEVAPRKSRRWLWAVVTAWEMHKFRFHGLSGCFECPEILEHLSQNFISTCLVI